MVHSISMVVLRKNWVHPGSAPETACGEQNLDVAAARVPGGSSTKRGCITRPRRAVGSFVSIDFMVRDGIIRHLLRGVDALLLIQLVEARVICTRVGVV